MSAGNGDEVLAVLGAQRDTDLCAIKECMRLNEMPSVDEVREASAESIGKSSSP